MIAYLSGTIKRRLPTGLVLDVGGVGYLILSPESVWQTHTVGTTFECWVATCQQSSITYYGFEQWAERSLFLHLMRVLV